MFSDEFHNETTVAEYVMRGTPRCSCQRIALAVWFCVSIWSSRQQSVRDYADQMNEIPDSILPNPAAIAEVIYFFALISSLSSRELHWLYLPTTVEKF